MRLFLNSIYLQVNELRVYAGTGGEVQSISSCAGDGKLVIWDLKSLASRMANLRL
jgi:hypothetical protein